MNKRSFHHRFIVFDLDGTLVDSQHTIVHCMGRAFTADGLAAPDAKAVRGIIGLKLEVAVNALLPEPDEVRAGRVADHYRVFFNERLSEPDHEEPLFEGAREALAAINQPEVCLGIATGKGRNGLLRVLRRHSLEQLFVNLKTADDGPSKPHPQILQEAMAEVGAVPEETVVIGDTAFDVQMARNAGCDAIGVDWGYHDRQQLYAAGAGLVIDHFSDLEPALAGFAGVQR